MIYTVTLNPAIDHIFETNGFTIGETNYYQQQYQVIGGKGINVAIVLNNLGSDVIATGILGSLNHDLFYQKFQEIHLQHNFFLNQGSSRTNLKIKNLSKKEETELNGTGDTVTVAIISELKQFLENKLQANDILVAAGSIPLGVNSKIYYELGLIAKKKQATFILDSAKENLAWGLKAQPFLIKPNLAELCQLLNCVCQVDDFTKICQMITKVKALGAQNILLSLGSKGSYFFTNDNAIHQIGIAKGKVVNSVGAGDSMLAGLVYGLANKFSVEQTLQYASASASATVFTQWLATKPNIEALLKQIKIKKIERG